MQSDGFASPQALPDLYTRLYSERRFDEWRRLFDDAAVVVRVDASGARQTASIDAATASYARHATSCREILETWTSVNIQAHGDLAILSARYTLHTDGVTREGIDLLTLCRGPRGWKIACLAYQQTGMSGPRASVRAGTATPDVNLADLLSLHAQRTPTRVAIRHDTAEMTFAMLDTSVWQCANLLAADGVVGGDIVALSLRDEMAAIVAMLATARIGATVFWVPPISAPELQQRMLKGVPARVMVVDPCESTAREGMPPTLALDLATLGRNGAVVHRRIRSAQPSAPWTLLTGSGSTGAPKLLPVKHRQYLEQLRVYRDALRIGPEDRIGSLLSIDTVVTRERFLDAVLTGACVVLGGARNPPSPEWIENSGVTVLWSTVVHAEALLRSIRESGVETAPSTLRAFVVGSSTVSGTLRKRLGRFFGPRLHVYYGTNELGLATLAGPAELRADPLTVGRAAPGVSVQVIDAQGNHAPPGQTGRIRIRAPGVIAGYLGDEAASARHFSGDWFTPGDLGSLDARGLLDFRGREDDLMLFDGISIHPAEIERALAALDGVAEVIAIPVPHPVHQDLPAAVVVLEAGAPWTPASLAERARAVLGSRAPAIVVTLPAIPRNAQGKPLRKALQAILIRHLPPLSAEDTPRGSTRPQIS